MHLQSSTQLIALVANLSLLCILVRYSNPVEKNFRLITCVEGRYRYTDEVDISHLAFLILRNVCLERFRRYLEEIFFSKLKEDCVKWCVCCIAEPNLVLLHRSMCIFFPLFILCVNKYFFYS